MARILYGVQGDSNGHINRSLTVAEILAGHELLFVGGGTAAKARDAGYNYEPMPLMGMQVRDNAVQVLPTFLDLAGKWAGQRKWLRRLRGIISAFDPDLILTDYEYFTPRAARALGRPCLSLDHQHVLSRTVCETPPGQRFSRLLTTTLMKYFIPGLHGSLITSFHQPPLIDPERDALFGVLPRSDVSGMEAEAGEHVTMYLPGCDPEKICGLFGPRRRECRVYGLGFLPERGNVKFLPASRGGFLQDLASSAYVVCCGGHGLLTEALLFGKPCLCFPGRLLYEQFWNCHFVQKNGYGRYYPDFDVAPGIVDAFEAGLDAFAARIKAQSFNGRRQLRDRLNALLGS